MKVLKLLMCLANSYFESVTESLDLFNWAPESYDQANDLVETIIQRFSHHPNWNKTKYQNFQKNFQNHWSCLTYQFIIKKDLTDKSNFWPISILPLILKVFEKVIFDQLCNYVNRFLSSLLCRFRKVHSTQHALFKLLQVWQKELEQCGFVTAIYLWIYLKRMTD